MKIYRIFIVVVSILFIGAKVWGQSLVCKITGLNCPVNIQELVLREGLYFKPFSDEPFTGKVAGVENGKVTKGHKVGDWLVYNKNGQLVIKTNYKDGKLHGHHEEFYSGISNKKGHYEGGKKQGFWREGSNNSFREGHYEGGKKQGLWKEVEFSKVMEGNYEDDKKHGLWKGSIEYDDRSDAIEGHYKEGNKHGLWKEHYGWGPYFQGLKDGRWNYKACRKIVGTFNLSCSMKKFEEESGAYYTSITEYNSCFLCSTKISSLECYGKDKDRKWKRDQYAKKSSGRCFRDYVKGEFVRQLFY